jgi:hypothetical protein
VIVKEDYKTKSRNILLSSSCRVRFASDHPKIERPELQEPNLLFVLVDQWRRSAMGFMNDDPVETPNMDAFADDVAVFNHAVATVPVCTPDRAVLMTGN